MEINSGIVWHFNSKSNAVYVNQYNCLHSLPHFWHENVTSRGGSRVVSWGGIDAKIGTKGANFARFWPILEGAMPPFWIRHWHLLPLFTPSTSGNAYLLIRSIINTLLSVITFLTKDVYYSLNLKCVFSNFGDNSWFCYEKLHEYGIPLEFQVKSTVKVEIFVRFLFSRISRVNTKSRNYKLAKITFCNRIAKLNWSVFGKTNEIAKISSDSFRKKFDLYSIVRW